MEATLMPNGVRFVDYADGAISASVPLDHFGAIADSTIPKLLYSNTKRERRVAFREMDKLFRLAFKSSAEGRTLLTVSFGADANGVVRAIFYYSATKETS